MWFTKIINFLAEGVFRQLLLKKNFLKKERKKSRAICYEFQENTTKKKCTQNQVENTKK